MVYLRIETTNYPKHTESTCTQYFLTETLGGAFLSLDADEVPEADAAEPGVSMLETDFCSSRVLAKEDRLPVTLVTLPMLLVLTPAFAALRLAAPPAVPRELLFCPIAAGLVPPCR